MESCGGKRRLSRHGAGWCLGRNSTTGQEGSLKACLGIATARTAQSVPKCLLLHFSKWPDNTWKNIFPLGRCHETQLGAAYRDTRESSRPKVQICTRASCAAAFSAGCWMLVLLPAHASQPPTSEPIFLRAKVSWKIPENPRFARCVLKPGTVRQCCGAEQGRLGFESLCSQQCSPTKCSVETASVI